MRFPARIVAVLVFLILSIVALVLAGVLDWIVGVLFLTMEFLGGFIQEIFHRRKTRKHPPTRDRHVSAAIRHRPGIGRRGGRPRSRKAPDRSPATCSIRRQKILMPVTGDDPKLLEFALEECVSRQAELIVLFLRPMGVIPMGPNPLPGLSEDSEAKALFERSEEQAKAVGIEIRAIYEMTVNRSVTIGDVARSSEADVVVVGSSRKGRIARLLTRDPNPDLIQLLPERARLMINHC